MQSILFQCLKLIDDILKLYLEYCTDCVIIEHIFSFKEHLMTIELIKNTSMQDFIYKNKWEQQLFIEKVKINELKDKDKLPLLKKFIAMKVLMEVRNATKHSSLNLTAGFRDLLANLSPDLHQKVFKPNKSGDIMYEKEALLAAANIKSPNSYRLFHISDMGTYLWNRKFFKITVDENNIIITQKANTEKRLFDDPDTTIESAQTWDTLNDEYSLKMLFNEIEKETRYDNTLGYDLASVAFFCTNGLLNLSASLEFVKCSSSPRAQCCCSRTSPASSYSIGCSGSHDC